MLNIIAAFVLDVLFGDPQWLPHPVRLIGKYISSFEKQARKLVRSEAGERFAGVLLLVTTVGLSYLLAWSVLKLASSISPYLYQMLNIILMYTCIAARCLSEEGGRIYRALAEGDLAKARKLLSMIVGRDTDNLDESNITRGTVETIAENTSDGVIAPLFYMLLGGAPLAVAYKAVNTLDSMVGYKNDRYLHFGWASARFDDIANYIPARLTGILLVLAAMLLRLDYKQSFRMLIRDGRNHSSPNSGYPEAAAAGALGVQLGGTNHYFGRPVVKPVIGEASRPLNKEDIRKTARLMYTTALLMLLLGLILFAWGVQ